jgi:hypothetical protein
LGRSAGNTSQRRRLFRQTSDPPRPINVAFLPAKDNPSLLHVNPEYLASLLSLLFLEREWLLGGNSKI